MIDIISEHGFVPGVFDVGQSFGLLIERFKCYWKHFLRPAFPTLEDDYNAAKHCTCFGLSTLSAFPLHLKLRHPKALWSILIQASLYCNKESTGFRNCRSHWVPDWNLVWYPAICSAIKCMSVRVRYCHRLRDACLQGIQEGEMLKIIFPIFGWCSIRTFSNPCSRFLVIFQCSSSVYLVHTSCRSCPRLIWSHVRTTSCDMFSLQAWIVLHGSSQTCSLQPVRIT